MRARFSLEQSGHSATVDERGMIPLINIVFLMLVFFMVAGKVAVQEPAPFDAPDSRSEKRLLDAGYSLLLSANGELWLNGEPLAELSAEALAAAGLSAENRLVLKADAALPAERLDQPLTVLREAGLRQVELAVELETTP